jgi:hypothetical protein
LSCHTVLRVHNYVRQPSNKPLKRWKRVECRKCEGIRKRQKRLHFDHTCDLCGEVKSSRRKMIFHVESHLNLSCDVCKSRHKTKDTLRLHVRTHFQNFVCEQCGMKFEKLEQFRKHEIVHDPEKSEQKTASLIIIDGFPCSFCPLKFNRETTLKSHEAQLHKDGKAEIRFKCETCKKGSKIVI